MKEEQDRLKKLLHDTVSMLCRNSVPFQRGLRIEGVIGITVDDDSVFLVHINDTIGMPYDSGQYIKSECPVQSGTTNPMMLMPYNAVSSAAAAAAGSEHISSTVITESVMMADQDPGWTEEYEDNTDLAYPLMVDANVDMSFQQSPSAFQLDIKPRMPVPDLLFFFKQFFVKQLQPLQPAGLHLVLTEQ